MVPIAYMPSPIPRQVGWNLFARTIPFASAFPRNRGGSAPASLFSGPAQRSLTLRPTRSPSRLSDPLHQRLQQSRCLHCCSDCYRVERNSSRAGIPPLWTSAFTAHPVSPFDRHQQSSTLATMFFDHRACVLVLAYPSKFRVPKMIDLRFILHLFMA